MSEFFAGLRALENCPDPDELFSQSRAGTEPLADREKVREAGYDVAFSSESEGDSEAEEEGGGGGEETGVFEEEEDRGSEDSGGEETAYLEWLEAIGDAYLDGPDARCESALLGLRRSLRVRPRSGRGRSLERRANVVSLVCGGQGPLWSREASVRIAACELLREVAKDCFVLESLADVGAVPRLLYLTECSNEAVAAVALRAVKTCVQTVRRVQYGDPLTLEVSDDELEGEGATRSVEVPDRREHSLHCKQYRFSECGVGYKIWPAAHIMARWMFERRSEVIENRRVIELGAGPGVLAMVAGCHGAQSAVASDYLPEILTMCGRNARRNAVPNFRTELIDWNTVAEGDDSAAVPACDTLVGSDVIYGHALSELLARALAKLLAPPAASAGGDRVFYGLCQSNRIGVDEFPENCRKLGLSVDVSTVDHALHQDFFETCIWSLFTVRPGHPAG
jgi:Lysine methyltransferase